MLDRVRRAPSEVITRLEVTIALGFSDLGFASFLGFAAVDFSFLGAGPVLSY